jgi:ATP synthase subunit 6
MNFLNIEEIYHIYYISSPLDQFSNDDENDLNTIVYSLLDLFPQASLLDNFYNWIGFIELGNINDINSLILGSIGVFIFDDEDADSSEFEEAGIFSSSTQASIFSSNIIGMIPGIETSTSDASLTFMLSISTIIIISLIGFSLHSIRFFSLLYPTGTPTIMAPFIILIEFISYIARAVSLGMRLFANMFAGHSLVKILMSFAWLFLNSVLPVLIIPIFILLLAIFMMEVGIAYLQSYVFSALAAMYMEDAISLGH